MVFTRLRAAPYLLLCLMVTRAYAAPRTDDILNDLAPEVKAQILNGASDQEKCELRVLEKEMHIAFKPGPPSSNPFKLQKNGQCAANAPTPVVQISSASELKGVQTHWNWLRSYYGLCEYKKQLAEGMTRAAAKFKQNPNLRFLSGAELEKNPGTTCVMKSSKWIMSDTPGSLCKMAKGSPAEALQCINTNECRFDCGGGQHNLEMLGTLEVFAGSDRSLSEAEKKSFDNQYPKVVIGMYSWPNTFGLDYEDDSFSGKQIPKEKIDLSEEAKLGEYGLTGYKVVLDTKGTYQAAFLDKSSPYSKEATQLSSNGIIISTSSDGARNFAESDIEGDVTRADVVGQFETDMKTLTDQYLKLSFNPNAQEDAPTTWGSYDQLRRSENWDAIVKGTYSLKRSPSTSEAAWKTDQAAYREIQKILQKPMYRDTKIFINRGHSHPTDIVPLSEAILAKKATHPEALLSFYSYETNEKSNFDKFISSRIEACLGTWDAR